MTPGGPEDEVSQGERARIMRQDHDAKHGDADAYITRYAPALAPGRRLPELSEAQKEQIKKRIADEAEAKARGTTYQQLAQSDIDLPRDRFHVVNKASVVGQSGSDPIPKMSGYWAEADMGTERSFGQQLSEYGISQTSVPEKKR